MSKKSPASWSAFFVAIGLAFAPPPAASQQISSYDLSPERAKGWKLPPLLAEISGLASTAGGRLFAHNDEAGIIFELDFANGTIVKAFALGDKTVKDDFEGIAIAGNVFYLITSDGTLYEAPEGENGRRVLFNTYGTGIGKRCEIEGLAFDQENDDLVILCKRALSPALKGKIVIFRWNTIRKEAPGAPALAIAFDDIPELSGQPPIRPTGIEIDPATGQYIIVAARNHLVFEMSTGGKVTAVHHLSPDLHPQAEGITVIKGGGLVIADEGGAGPGSLIYYGKSLRPKP